MFASGNSDKQCCIITCLIFSGIWWLVGLVLVLVGYLAPPLYTEGTDMYEESKNDIYNTKIAGLVVLPLSCFWCMAMLFWCCKDNADFKRLQSERIAAVNAQNEVPVPTVSAPATGIASPMSAGQPHIVVTPVAIAVPYNVGHFCRKCGTTRQGFNDTFCVKCGASLTEGVPSAGHTSNNRSFGNASNISSITYPTNSYISPMANGDRDIIVNVSVNQSLAPPPPGQGRYSGGKSGGMPSQPPTFNDVMKSNNAYGVIVGPRQTGETE